jgi:hypothetical protein
MNLAQIVDALKFERKRIDAAISALTGQELGNGRRGGRRRAARANTTIRAKVKRRLSAAARKRISDAAKARWAKAKKAGKKSL